MSRLTDYELDTLLQDALAIDRTMRKREVMFPTVSGPLAPRMTRLLQESRELRDQAAEREHMAALEGPT
jgi:hypothetical protein